MITTSETADTEPRAFALQNLSSTAVTPCVPWAFKGTPPPSVHRDKKARDAWISQPKTEWQVYSLVEGLNDNQRVSLGNSVNRDGNPPYRLHGFAGDYDVPQSFEAALIALEGFPLKPQWFEQTLSGNVRLIWLFEKPILVASAAFLKFFLQEVLKSFSVDRLLPGFDGGAWMNCTRYYTNSAEWRKIEGAQPIPAERVRGWQVEIGNKFQWINELGAVEIPFEALRAALEPKYIRFAEWPGEFALGEQGPSFWIDDSTSPKSAIVRETGIQTFSAHATQGFYSWGHLLGHAFVKDYKTDSLGRAVEEIYHDGKYYWRKLPSGMWRGFSKEDTIHHLRVDRRVSTKREKETGASDMDRAILHVQNHQGVIGAGPFVLRPSGVIEVNGNSVLNISTRRVLQPAAENTPWGLTGKMPFLSQFFGFSDDTWSPGILPVREAVDHLLSWAHRYYKGGYDEQPTSGQTLFIAGPPDIGKNFINGLFGKLMGGAIDAEDFLIRNDNFNSDLFGYAHWTIDDAVMTATLQTLRTYSEKVKKLAANRSFRSNEKFRVATVVEWQGRLVATTNVDEESIRAIPDLGGTILDKIMLFRTVDKAPVEFLEQAEMKKLLDAEAPYFARKLLDYQIPDYCRSNARFGVKSYHDPSLILAAEHSSSTGAFVDILETWKKTCLELSVDDPWEGTAYELYQELAGGEMGFGTVKRHDSAWVGRQLSALKNKGHRIECTDGVTRKWKIYLADRSAKCSVTTNSK